MYGNAAACEAVENFGFAVPNGPLGEGGRALLQLNYSWARRAARRVPVAGWAAAGAAACTSMRS